MFCYVLVYIYVAYTMECFVVYKPHLTLSMCVCWTIMAICWWWQQREGHGTCISKGLWVENVHRRARAHNMRLSVIFVLIEWGGRGLYYDLCSMNLVAKCNFWSDFGVYKCNWGLPARYHSHYLCARNEKKKLSRKIRWQHLNYNSIYLNGFTISFFMRARAHPFKPH